MSAVGIEAMDCGGLFGVADSKVKKEADVDNGDEVEDILEEKLTRVLEENHWHRECLHRWPSIRLLGIELSSVYR